MTNCKSLTQKATDDGGDFCRELHDDLPVFLLSSLCFDRSSFDKGWLLFVFVSNCQNNNSFRCSARNSYWMQVRSWFRPKKQRKRLMHQWDLRSWFENFCDESHRMQLRPWCKAFHFHTSIVTPINSNTCVNFLDQSCRMLINIDGYLHLGFHPLNQFSGQLKNH